MKSLTNRFRFLVSTSTLQNPSSFYLYTGTFLRSFFQKATRRRQLNCYLRWPCDRHLDTSPFRVYISDIRYTGLTAVTVPATERNFFYVRNIPGACIPRCRPVTTGTGLTSKARFILSSGPSTQRGSHLPHQGPSKAPAPFDPSHAFA